MECIAATGVTSADVSCQRRPSDECDQSRVQPDLVRTSCTAHLSVVSSHVDSADNNRCEPNSSDTKMCDDSVLSVSTGRGTILESAGNLNRDCCDMNTEPAMLLRGPQDTTALVGDRVLLKATFTGNPLPEVQWMKSVSSVFVTLNMI